MYFHKSWRCPHLLPLPPSLIATLLGVTSGRRNERRYLTHESTMFRGIKQFRPLSCLSHRSTPNPLEHIDVFMERPLWSSMVLRGRLFALPSVTTCYVHQV